MLLPQIPPEKEPDILLILKQFFIIICPFVPQCWPHIPPESSDSMLPIKAQFSTIKYLELYFTKSPPLFENILLFGCIGIIELIFFQNIAIHYVPTKPSYFVNKTLTSLQNKF